MFAFRTVRNREVSPGAATDGFTAIRKTNAALRYLRRPGEQLTSDTPPNSPNDRAPAATVRLLVPSEREPNEAPGARGERCQRSRYTDDRSNPNSLQPKRSRRAAMVSARHVPAGEPHRQ